jgi:hypothetical protein
MEALTITSGGLAWAPTLVSMNGLERMQNSVAPPGVAGTSGYSERQAGAGQNDLVMLAKPNSAATLADVLALCLASKRASTP